MRKRLSDVDEAVCGFVEGMFAGQAAADAKLRAEKAAQGLRWSMAKGRWVPIRLRGRRRESALARR